MSLDYRDAKIEHLKELALARKYAEDPGIFFDRGRWHDHSCCPDCCGCDAEYSTYQTLDEYMGRRENEPRDLAG